MTALLNNKPVIGTFAGFFSWGLYVIKQLLTNDTVLKYIAGTGIWLGILVALLTVYLRLIEIKKAHKSSQINKNEKNNHSRITVFFSKLLHHNKG
jgi:hypothetical protein